MDTLKLLLSCLLLAIGIGGIIWSLVERKKSDPSKEDLLKNEAVKYALIKARTAPLQSDIIRLWLKRRDDVSAW